MTELKEVEEIVEDWQCGVQMTAIEQIILRLDKIIEALPKPPNELGD